MKKSYQAILYIFLLLIIAAGLLLFLWRDNALNSLNESFEINKLESATKTAVISKDTLDSDILSAPKFVALKNNVNIFDFDSICKESVGKTVSTIKTIEIGGASSTAATSSAAQKVNCIIGNSIPFPVPAKKVD